MPSILIVDDDEEIRHILRMLFEHEGYTIVGEASDGVEAVMLARRMFPGLIVLDQRMPGMSGAKAAEVLRALCPNVKIVAFSAFLDHQPQWADAFLNKDRIGDIVPLLARLIGPSDTNGARVDTRDMQAQR
jgi:CheY-like chemotaxis protein